MQRYLQMMPYLQIQRFLDYPKNSGFGSRVVARRNYTYLYLLLLIARKMSTVVEFSARKQSELGVFSLRYYEGWAKLIDLNRTKKVSPK